MRNGLDPVERLRCRDEVLQVLFWLTGEGFEEDMTPAGIAKFTGLDIDDIRSVLADAVAAGLADAVSGGRFELSRDGRREGGRRFVEEFADIRARETHGGGCSDPDCDCHTGAEVPCVHAHHGAS